MFDKQTTAPLPALSTVSGWRTPEGGRRPVLCITNGQSRIFIDPSDFPNVARTMVQILDSEAVGS